MLLMCQHNDSRGSRRTNETEESSSDASSIVIPQPSRSKKPTNLDASLNNPTPAMLAILERRRNKQETSPVASSKKKHARYIFLRSNAPWLPFSTISSFYLKQMNLG